MSKKTPIFNKQKAYELMQPYWVCDASKAKRELNFQSKIDIEEGMKITLDWYVKNKWM